jgi:hypothetical protein
MNANHAELLTDAVEEACAVVPGAARLAWIEDIAAGYEEVKRAAESKGVARHAGTWYTPSDTVTRLLDAAMTPRPTKAFSACDPACGTGNFLVAIGDRLKASGWTGARIAAAVHGMDLDPFAAAVTRVRLRLRFGGAAALWRSSIRCGDALVADAWAGCEYSLVAGNPPFLSQLGKKSVRSRAEQRALLKRFNGHVAGYADTASAFLLLGTELAPRGTVALLQPMSTLSAADALPIRNACEARMKLAAVLMLPDNTFGAAVRTCIPMLTQRAPATLSISNADGHVHRIARQRCSGGAWGAALAAARGVPDPHAASTAGTLDDWMRSTADFRQHYYGLRGHVHASEGAAPSPQAPALVTVGAIGAARLEWGARPVRIHGRTFYGPIIRTHELLDDAVLGPWVAARRGPKILVATQTRAIEAWVDEKGIAMPSTPAITVTPKRAADLWKVAAALLAPATAAEAWWRHAGAGMSAQAIRVSASQLRALPAPGNHTAWGRAARALAAWQRLGTIDARDEFAGLMCDAYGVPAGAARERLLEWWRVAVTDARHGEAAASVRAPGRSRVR